MDNLLAHILVVDDDNRIRDLVKQYLSGKKYLVSTAKDAFDAKKKLDIIKFDILILDINMPEYDGIEVLKFFKIKKINLKVIILSSYDDVKLVQEMINLGANGFLSKDSAGQHIVEAIRTVHEGEQYFSDTIKNNLLKLYTGKNVRPGQRPQSTIANSLTDRETEVLKLISQEYSSPEIAQILNISQSTVDTYRKSLLKKTNVKNAVGLAMYAVKNKII